MYSTAYIHIFVRILVSLSVLYFYFYHLNKNHNSRFKHVEILCGTFLLTFFLFGCLPSLHPLYTDDTLIFDEQLVGKWHGDDNIWTFSKSGEKEYELRISDEEGKEALLQVHLVEIGSHRYLDLFPSGENREELFPYWMPVHTFMKVELSDPNLQLQWVLLGELIEEDPNILKHEIIPEANRNISDIAEEYPFLITARSEDIQRVILKYPEQITEDSGDSGVLKRCPSIFKEKDIIFEKTLLGKWRSGEEYFIEFTPSKNNGYNVVYGEKDEEQQHFNGILYRFNGQSILGFYTKTPSQNEIEAGLHLIPDFFLLVDYVEDELRSWQLDWEDMEEYKVKDMIYNFDALKEPDIVFKKNSKESKKDK